MESQGETDYVQISLQTPRDRKESVSDDKIAAMDAAIRDSIAKTPRIRSASHEKDFKLFKVLVIGDPGVGKSSFIKRYVHGLFSPQRITTIGLDFIEHTFQWDSDTEVKLHFWDVPGQQRLSNQTGMFYRDTRAILVVYDACDIASLTQARKWKREADKQCTLNGRGYRPPAILLANKIDLACERSEEFSTYALDLVVREEGFRCGFPISNLGNYNIAQTVRKLVELLLEEDKILRGSALLTKDDEAVIDLAEVFEPRHEKQKCEC
jgi:Ras-related protein Rab-32